MPLPDGMSVDVIVEDARWSGVGIDALAERAVAATLAHLKADGEVAVLACDDARIAALNANFRGKNTPTNVLSWPSEERAATDDGARPDAPRESELGDIAIAYETCRREAEVAGLTLEDHALHLLIHGTLHLLGYDHERDGDADLMEATEIAILGALGVADPYGRSGA